jgi:S1-C subfamily serine protease
VVVEVDSGGPADEAGMETGDIIIAVNNEAMGADQDLRALIGGHKPGDEVAVTLVRPGEAPELMNLEVILGSETNEEGEEVARLGLKYRTVSSGIGWMSMPRLPRSGGQPRTD